MLSGGDARGDIGAAAQIGDATFAALVAAARESAAALAGAQGALLGSADLQQVWAASVRTARMLEATSTVLLAQILDCGGFVGSWGSTPHTVGALLNCSTQEASKRIRHATVLAPRVLPSGERTQSAFPHTAAAAAAGVITDAHVSIVDTFFGELSDEVDPETCARAEHQLGVLARTTRPREFGAAAARLALLIDEDGPEPKDDRDRARTPHVTFGKQGKDGLTPGKFLLDPEATALAQAIDAKLSRPGANTDTDPQGTDTGTDTGTGTDPQGTDTGTGTDAGSRSCTEPHLDLDLDLDDTDHTDHTGPSPAGPDAPSAGTAGPDAPSARTPGPPKRWDLRSAGERRHDALKVILSSYLTSGKAGTHRGVSCVPIVTMTLDQLESASGVALTATGSTIPVRDALRMASGQHAFLLLLDENERPLYFGRTRRLAAEDQRLVLYATERGCSFPGCSKPSVWCQVHHTDEWAHDDGFTDIDTLTLACEEHHPLVGPGDNQWATTIAAEDHQYPGRTLWHPPAVWDPSRTGRVNHFFRPEELLRPPEDQR